MKIEIVPGFGKIDCGKETETHFAVKLTGEARDGADKRSPVTVVALLDISGSMGSSGKMDGLKASMRELVRQLGPDDRLSMVAYDDRVEVLMIPTPMDMAAKDKASAMIDRLSPRGCTDIGAAMLAGYDLFTEHGMGTGVNRMILFTDGCPNQGARTADELASLAARRPEGVQVSAMGYGSGDARRGDIDLDLLTAVADSGDGNFHYMEDPDMCAKAFARELSGILSVDCVDIRVSVDGSRMKDIVCLEPESDKGAFRLADILAGETRVVLFKGTLPAADKPWARDAKVADVSVRAVALADPVLSPDFKGGLKVRFVKAGDGDREMNKTVADRKAVLDMAAAHKAAYALADRGDFTGARKLVDDFEKTMPDFARTKFLVGNEKVKAMFNDVQTYGATLYARKATDNSLLRGRASGGLMDDDMGKEG